MTINLPYSSPSFKSFDVNSSKSYTIHIPKDGPLLYLALANIGRGGQGLGRKNRIFEIYINKDSRAHAGLLCQDHGSNGGQFYRYVEFGTMKIAGEDL
jgi:hypothetical protein